MIKVLIVDDHGIVRAGIAKLLSESKEIRVIGMVDSGESALHFLKHHEERPQVILMDVRMPGIGGLETTRRVLQKYPIIRVIVLTVCWEEPFPSKFLEIGAAGYLTKSSEVLDLLQAIKTVCHARQRYIDPKIAQQLALSQFKQDKSSDKSREKNNFKKLSERELQIMMMITSGKKVPKIAQELCLSAKTINSYRYRLFEKLSLSCDVELTHFAIRHGLVESPAFFD